MRHSTMELVSEGSDLHRLLHAAVFVGGFQPVVCRFLRLCELKKGSRKITKRQPVIGRPYLLRKTIKCLEFATLKKVRSSTLWTVEALLHGEGGCERQ